MARSANSKNIRRDEDGPDYQAVVDLVRGQLRNNDAEQRSLAQDNSTIFKRIEKQHGVHKGAAKDFGKVDSMSPEKRTDYLRSFLGLLGIAGYDKFDDLVDRMRETRGGKAAPKGGKPKADAGPKAQAPDAIDDAPLNIDLKTGMVIADDGTDVREATPDELAAARERMADFPVEDGNVHPFPAKAH